MPTKIVYSSADAQRFRRLLLGIILIAAMALDIAIFFPGMMTFNAREQLTQAGQHVFSDHHPPIMSWLWGLLLEVAPGPLGMLIVQVVLFWGSLGLCVLSTLPRYPRRCWLFLAIGLVPPLLCMTGLILKDTGMTVAWMMTSAIALRYTLLDKKPGIYATLALAASFFYGLSVRYNAAAGAWPLLFWIVLLYRPQPPRFSLKNAGISLALLLLAMAGSHWLTDRLSSQKNYLQQEIYFQDTACMSLHENKVFFPDYLTRRPAFSLHTIEGKRAPGSVSYGMREWDAFYTQDPEEVAAFYRYWKDLIWQHPLLYLSCRWDIFASLWRIGYDGAYTSFAMHYSPYAIERPPLEGDGWFASFSNAAFEATLQYLAPLYNSMFNMPYMVFLLAALLMARALKPSPLALPILCLTSSGMLYMLAYFFIAISADLRYVSGL